MIANFFLINGLYKTNFIKLVSFENSGIKKIVKASLFYRWITNTNFYFLTNQPNLLLSPSYVHRKRRKEFIGLFFMNQQHAHANVRFIPLAHVRIYKIKDLEIFAFVYAFLFYILLNLSTFLLLTYYLSKSSRGCRKMCAGCLIWIILQFLFL